jgi:hypothetical protein
MNYKNKYFFVILIACLVLSIFFINIQYTKTKYMNTENCLHKTNTKEKVLEKIDKVYYEIKKYRDIDQIKKYVITLNDKYLDKNKLYYINHLCDQEISNKHPDWELIGKYCLIGFFTKNNNKFIELANKILASDKLTCCNYDEYKTIFPAILTIAYQNTEQSSDLLCKIMTTSFWMGKGNKNFMSLIQAQVLGSLHLLNSESINHFEKTANDQLDDKLKETLNINTYIKHISY